MYFLSYTELATDSDNDRIDNRYFCMQVRVEGYLPSKIFAIVVRGHYVVLSKNHDWKSRILAFTFLHSLPELIFSNAMYICVY